MDNAETRIFMIAGETSGDQYAGALARALQTADDTVILRGMGGPEMAQAGVELLQDFRGLDVMGFWDVLTRLGTFRRVFREICAELDAWKPDVLVLIDYPGFNIRIAREAHKRGITVVYYISPKVWVWKAGRIPKLAEYCRKMLVLFDFEVEVYKDSGLDTVYVGHPLAEELLLYRDRKAQYRQELGIAADDTLIGLLPGSRRTEIKRMYPVMLEAAQRLADREEKVRFIVGCAPGFDPEYLQSFHKANHPPLEIIENKSRELMAASDAMMITSGTATLEAGLIGVPHVLCYRVGLLTYWIAKPLIHTADVGLVNIALGRRVLPELIQGDLNPARVCDEINEFLHNDQRSAQVHQDLQELFTRLSCHAPYEKAAEEIVKTLKESKPREA